MKSFISENNIEQTICNRLSLSEYGWERIVTGTASGHVIICRSSADNLPLVSKFLAAR